MYSSIITKSVWSVLLDDAESTEESAADTTEDMAASEEKPTETSSQPPASEPMQTD